LIVTTVNANIYLKRKYGRLRTCRQIPSKFRIMFVLAKFQKIPNIDNFNDLDGCVVCGAFA